MYFSETITNTGTIRSCSRIPGTDIANAPVQNADRPKVLISRPAHRKRANPQTKRPKIMEIINDTYKKLEKEFGATVVSLYDSFSSYCNQNGIAVDQLLCDGLHPNNEGYKVMYDMIIEAFGV